MKAFRFPLHAVLTLREEREQEAQRGLARALAELAVIREEVAAMGREVDALGADLTRRLQGQLAAEELERYGAFRGVLLERQRLREQDLTMAEATVREARARLLRATQDRQALEQYRDKLRRRFDYQQAGEERKMLDDLAGRQPALGTGRGAASAAYGP